MVSFSELLSKAGTITGDFLVDAGNSIADNYCGLYRDYPQFIVGSSIDPIQPFRRALADSLCSGRDPGLPPPPSVPFTGGQCECKIYELVIRIFDNASSQIIEDRVINVWGEVGGIVLRPEPLQPESINAYVVCRGIGGTGQTVCGDYKEYPLTNYGVDVTYTILSCTPSDGIDNCGDPAPDYPAVYPPPPRVEPPIPYTPPSGAPSFNIPVVFVPVTNNLNIPVNLDLDVDFNFNFDAGGLSFDFGGGNGGSGDGFTPADRDSLTQAGSNAAQAANQAGDAKNAAEGASDAANAAKDAANAAKDAADRAAKNTEAPPPPGSPETDEEDKPPEDNNRDNVKDLLYVKITLTQFPLKGKSQWGEGAPNVYYAGWFEWKFGGFPIPREPIHYQQSLFIAPKGADGYAYTLVNDAEGFATEITRKVEE